MTSDLRRAAMQKNLPTLPPKFAMPGSGSSQQHRSKGGVGRLRNFTPLPWSEFFDDKRTITTDKGDKFAVYLKGRTGPVFYLLHGGGYSGLTWACFAEELSSRIECRIVAPDLRGHGDTVTDDDVDLSTDRQVDDIATIYDQLFAQDKPAVFLMGHSMGGALAVHVGCSGRLPPLIALAVIDVVEGSAMDALSGMMNFLRGRPGQFRSVQAAIEWCLKTGTTRNARAARVSMPTQVKPVISYATAGNCASFDEMSEEREAEGTEADGTMADGTAADGSQQHTNEHSNSPDSAQEWRIDLTKSEPYWKGWFSNLSSLFLSVSAPKLLILAGVDRLDKDLTVGQMQGKFQMVVLPKVGHAVQEDSPDKLADLLATFCVRHKVVSEAKGTFDPVYPGC